MVRGGTRPKLKIGMGPNQNPPWQRTRPKPESKDAPTWGKYRTSSRTPLRQPHRLLTHPHLPKETFRRECPHRARTMRQAGRAPRQRTSRTCAAPLANGRATQHKRTPPPQHQTRVQERTSEHEQSVKTRDSKTPKGQPPKTSEETMTQQNKMSAPRHSRSCAVALLRNRCMFSPCRP